MFTVVATHIDSLVLHLGREGRGHRLIGFLLAIGIGLFGLSVTSVSTATAAEPGEVAASTLEMTPIGGRLYKEKRVPVDWRVEVSITAPFPDYPKVRPVKKITAGFPQEMAFVPAKGLPVCPDRILNPGATGLGGLPVEPMIERCPGALIGNGRARLYLAKNNSPAGTNLNNSELAIFYGGKTATGTPRLKVYGFDREVSAGVYMEGTWIDNVLEVEIPQLPFDTSTGFFELSIPGRDTGFPKRIGRDSGFVRANCPDGLWEGTSEFLIGERDSSGLPFGDDSLIRAPDFRSDCVGLDGMASLALTTPGLTRSVGRRSSFSVVVSNPGTATARDIRLRVSGKGVRQASSLATIPVLPPGSNRKVTANLSFAKPGPARIQVSALGSGLKRLTVARVVKVR